MESMLTGTSPRLGVIGAGPSGLAVSLFLNNTPDILEQQTHVGGHASSFMANGFTFDYGPHILFSRDQAILDFIVGSLGDNVSRCRRNNKICYKNSLVNYPFENDLKSLPLEDNYDCLHRYLFNPYKETYANPTNMKQWFLKTFGEGICSRYLFPYNEKVWNIPVEQLSMSMANRIPNPPADDILKSSLGYHTEGYLHQLYYFYPKKGGYQAICEAWQEKLAVTFQFKVNKIQRVGEMLRVWSEAGCVKEYRQLISTMPVDELIAKIDIPIPTEIQVAVDSLLINPMFVVSFGVRGVDPNQYTAVYFPEEDFLVNRISYPCTFSNANGPAHHWSIQAEITCHKQSDTWYKSDGDIVAHTKRGLQQRHLLPGDEAIVFERIDRIARSYVVYNVGYEENAEKVRAWFASVGIHLLGRFSYFEYINVDMAVARALKLAAMLNGDNPDCPNTKSRYLQTALKKVPGVAACPM